MDQQYLQEPLDGHRDRLRRKLANVGAENMRPHELVEFLLYYVLPRQDVHELARAILKKFDSVKNMLRGELEDFQAVEGIGESAAQWLYMISSCVRCVRKTQPMPRCRASNYYEMFRYARSVRRAMKRSCVVQLCLDEEGFIVQRSLVSQNRRWGLPGCMISALDDAFCARVKDMVLVICCPQAVPRPSEYDIEMVKKYAYLLRMAKCRLADVVLAGNRKCVSMRLLNLVPEGIIEPAFQAKIEDFPIIKLLRVGEDPLEDIPDTKQLRVRRVLQSDD